MKSRLKFIIPLGLVLVLAILPKACDGERKELTEAERAGKPGSFVTLPDGVVHFETAGPVAGSHILLVHGFSTPYFIYDHVFAALVKAGFRVTRFDLYGRGFSDRPDVPYAPALFDRQLIGLLDHLGIKTTAIVGSSMGGLITANFIRNHPERVTKVALIAPAGFPMELPFNAKLGRAPLIGDYVVRAFGDRIFLGNNKSGFERMPDDFIERFREQMQFRGFKRAILSSLRNMPLESGESIFVDVGKLKKPTLLLWSRQDGVLPFSNSERALAAIPHAEFHPLEGTGHSPHYETPEKVIPLLLKFFEK
ncbi:MAG: alpha/beta hydrolase [Leptospirales bacterium]|nr:alpha/beta hydrolase [Leptospirales bacterium]